MVEIEKANLGAFVWTTAILAAAHGQLDDRAAVADLLRELPVPQAEFIRACRDLLDKWFEPALREHLLDGLRKAGVDRPDGESAPSADPND